MAEIFSFPEGIAPQTQDPEAQLPPRPRGVPDEVWRAVESVRAMRRLPGVRYREIPVPSTLADYGIGVALGIGADDAYSRSFLHLRSEEHASGWIMLLYSRRPREEWGGRWRCVCFARMPLDSSENDGLAPSMYWEDMCDYLCDVEPDSVAGTVSVTQNTVFGSQGADTFAGCEIRVSYTPSIPPAHGFEPGGCVEAWAEFLKSTVRGEGESRVERTYA